MRSLICGMALLCAGTVAADVVQAGPRIRPGARSQARAQRIRNEGGLVEAPYTGKVIRILNLQKRPVAAAVETYRESVYGLFSFKVEASDAAAAPSVGESIRANRGNAGLVIALTEEAGDDRLVIAPENGWAVVNVAALAADGPAADALDRRLVRELWRATCHALGAANSMYPECVMKSVVSLKDLDELLISAPCPEIYEKMREGASRFGIGSVYRVTYQKACIEGYAKPPTNDLQKAIWDAAHDAKERGPANALQIVPPKK